MSETNEFVTLKVKKSYSKRLVNAIVSTNSDVQVEEGEEAYILSAPYIKVTRSDIEGVTGKLSDGRWRMLFMNRQGEIRDFDNYEFSMGTKSFQAETIEKKETVQMNVRIDQELKNLMETYRELLNINQNEFVSEALAEYISQLKKERIA